MLVTTQGPAPTGPSISMIDLRDGMSRKDAVELITKEINCSNEEGAAELVELLDRSPLSIAWYVRFWMLSYILSLLYVWYSAQEHTIFTSNVIGAVDLHS